MKFDDLDQRMRAFETAHDVHISPGQHRVARLDGRSFTRLTKETIDFEAPFDSRFRDHMYATVRHLMSCGPRISLAYCQSDEISLLFAPDEGGFGGKMRKLNSVLAGEASAAFALRLGSHAAFDCRVSVLPSEAAIVDYFRWRSEDAYRNSLSAHCYWMLRKGGDSPRRAAKNIDGLSMARKVELLLERGLSFEELPGWQTRGSLFFWEDYEKEGFNPVTQEKVYAARRRIQLNAELPGGPELSGFLESLMQEHYVPADAAKPSR